MKYFLKDNSYYIIRLLGTQVGLTVFAMMLTFAAVAANDSLSLIASVFSVLFYCALVYSTCWEMGAKNEEKIESGRLVQSKGHGFAVCAVSYVPVALLVLLLWVGLAFFDQQWAVNLFYIVDKILLFVFAMYRGIVIWAVNAIFGSLTQAWDHALVLALLYTASLLPGILAAGIGYLFGRKGIALSKPKHSVE